MDHHSQAGFMISHCTWGASSVQQVNTEDGQSQSGPMMPDFPCWHCNSLVGRALHPTCLHAPHMYISGRFHRGLSQFTSNRGSMFISVSIIKYSFSNTLINYSFHYFHPQAGLVTLLLLAMPGSGSPVPGPQPGPQPAPAPLPAPAPGLFFGKPLPFPFFGKPFGNY